MDVTMNVVKVISTLLDSEKYNEAIKVLNEDKFVNSFNDNCWELTYAIIRKLENDTLVIKPSLYNACEELLTLIALKTQPEEALLEFIEQIELAKNDAQFTIILKPLQPVVQKLITKRTIPLQWCFNAIGAYIEKILPIEHFLEGDERLLLDSDANARRILKIYHELPYFYRPFINHVQAAGQENYDISINKLKQVITAFLIGLLGKPMIYIDVDAKSEFTPSCLLILQDICTLEKNVLKFLPYLKKLHDEKENSAKSQLDDNENVSPYDQKERINMTTVSGLFYIVLSNRFEVPDMAIPQVYSNEYVVHTGMLAVLHLLSFTECGPLTKAITLFTAVMNRMSAPVSHTVLSSSIHYDICKSLSTVAIYSNFDSVRKDSVNCIKCFINIFEYNGRCMLINFLLTVANHSGMIGFAITLYKNSIDEAFKANEKWPNCFSGQQFLNMVKKICYLPHGPESDLVEHADQIITALNLLRYLAIKDTKNLTGIKECFLFLKDDYLSHLRIALDMSKAHFQIKLKDIEEGKGVSEENISITVAGNILDKIPIENKKQIIISALNAFSLIEALLARLTESLRNGRRYVLPLTSINTNNTFQRIRKHSHSTLESNIEKDVRVAVVTNEQEDHQYEEDIKTRIMENALQFVPKSGWSVESISAGAEAAGYPGITHGLFPNGGGDLVHYFNVKCNDDLVSHMKTWPKEDLKHSKVPAKFIENAIMTRLLMMQQFKSTWPKAIALQALPNNVPNCLAALLSLVDDICYHSGDRSVDFNWYVRRVGLAGIYKTAELFYLTDSSQESNATRNFVSSRIRDAQLIQTALNMNPVATAPQTMTAAFVTAKNILGINTVK